MFDKGFHVAYRYNPRGIPRKQNMVNIAVIGAGYVGLTTGACLSYVGHNVTIADLNASRIAGLQKGEIPFVEPLLSEIVADGLRSERLTFVTGAINACKDAKFHFLCLPTPPDDDGSTELSFFQTAVDEISEALQPTSSIINKSPVPVGTAKIISEQINRRDISIVSNPEFLAEGNAVNDFLSPSRIVIGAETREDARRVEELYSNIDAPVLLTGWESAELIKHTANAFLAMKLTFVNEIATLCEKTGADIQDVAKGIGYDPRIGASYLNPGPGWGGSCFPKDSSSLVHVARKVGFDFTLLEHAIQLNKKHVERTAGKVLKLLSKEKNSPKVAAWGLTFKAGTDDLRSSPAIEVLSHLIAEGIKICAYDPTVTGTIEQIPEVSIETDPYASVEDADVLVVLTEWEEFNEFEMGKVANMMKSPSLVDTRNLFDREEMESVGFTYFGMGL